MALTSDGHIELALDGVPEEHCLEVFRMKSIRQFLSVLRTLVSLQLQLQGTQPSSAEVWTALCPTRLPFFSALALLWRCRRRCYSVLSPSTSFRSKVSRLISLLQAWAISATRLVVFQQPAGLIISVGHGSFYEGVPRYDPVSQTQSPLTALGPVKRGGEPRSDLNSAVIFSFLSRFLYQGHVFSLRLFSCPRSCHFSSPASSRGFREKPSGGTTKEGKGRCSNESNEMLNPLFIPTYLIVPASPPLLLLCWLVVVPHNVHLTPPVGRCHLEGRSLLLPVVRRICMCTKRRGLRFLGPHHRRFDDLLYSPSFAVTHIPPSD